MLPLSRSAARSPVFLAAMFLLLPFAASPLHAPAEDAKPPAANAAKDLYDRAAKAYKDKKYEDALDAYRELLDKHRSNSLVSSKLKEIQSRLEECEIQVGVVKRASQVFKGKAQLSGKNVLKLSYDFSADDQLEDFQVTSPEGVKIVDGQLELSHPFPRGYLFCTFKKALWEDEVVVDVEVTLPDAAETEACAIVYMNENTWSGYRFSLHYNDADPLSDRPRYVHVIRKETEKSEREYDKTFNLGTATKPVLESGKKYRWKLVARQGAVQMLLNNAPIIAKQDPTWKKGLLLLGGGRGAVRYDNLVIEGRVNADWLRKAFSEAETLATRAKKKDELAEKDAINFDPLAPLSVEDAEALQSIDKEAVRAYTLARQHQFFRDVDKAIELYTAALKADPGFAAALVRRAQCHALKGDDERALADLDAAIARHADFYEAYRERGDVHFGRDRLEPALADYAKALEIKPGYGRALASLAYVKFAQGEREKAMAEADAALKEAPEDIEVKRIHRNLRNAVAGPPWRKDKTFVKETDHYLVKTDISAKAAAAYAQHLEAIFKLYTDKFGYKADLRQKARVYIFETQEGYQTYAELSTDERAEYTLGYYHPHYRELLLFEDLDKEQTLRVLYHEGFHQFLHQLIPQPPYWFNEGVAEYFGASRVEGGKVTATGLIQEGRLSNLKMAMEEGLNRKFADIINAPPREFYGGGHMMVAARYAQAWSMVHFFFQYGDGRYFPLLRDYYKSLRDGATQKAAFDAAFGKANLTALEKEWKEYVKKLQPPKR